MIWLFGFVLIVLADLGIAWVMGQLARPDTPLPPYPGPEGGRRTFSHPSYGLTETEEAA